MYKNKFDLSYGGKYLLKSALDCFELYHYIDI
jgi:hypothetical protein